VDAITFALVRPITLSHAGGIVGMRKVRATQGSVLPNGKDFDGSFHQDTESATEI